MLISHTFKNNDDDDAFPKVFVEWTTYKYMETHVCQWIVVGANTSVTSVGALMPSTDTFNG